MQTEVIYNRERENQPVKNDLTAQQDVTKCVLVSSVLAHPDTFDPWH